jgi:3-deoxy-D-manno-octulosonic-acid transferase
LVERVVEGLRPRLFILVEGDAWPNLQWSLGRHGTPRLLVNARLSPRSFRRYNLAPALARELLGGFELILAQSEQDRQRLAGLGLGPAGLETGGNLKFDAAPEAVSAERCRELRQKWSLGDRPVVVAGSTHPGEEEVCLQALERLGGRFEDLTLVLAPRDTRRGKELARLAEAWGWSACRISQGAPSEGCRVIILDRMGLLARAYGLGRAAFVGGSLVAQGGHNPLEPAVAGLPVIFGPHMEDFAGVAQGLERAGAAHTVHEPEDLAAWWELWLSDPDAAGKAGEAGRGLCRDNQGVVARTLDRVEALLSAGPGAARP